MAGSWNNRLVSGFLDRILRRPTEKSSENLAQLSDISCCREIRQETEQAALYWVLQGQLRKEGIWHGVEDRWTRKHHVAGF
jgi:hypothetical protein